MTIIDESRAHADLRDRLDHLRAVADARQRVHAFIEAYDRLQTWGPVFRANGLALDLADLRVLLDAGFAPTADRKWRDDDDEDETGLHRRQAAAQLGRGGPSPAEVLATQHVREDNPEFPDESPDDRDFDCCR